MHQQQRKDDQVKYRLPQMYLSEASSLYRSWPVVRLQVVQHEVVVVVVKLKQKESEWNYNFVLLNIGWYQINISNVEHKV